MKRITDRRGGARARRSAGVRLRASASSASRFASETHARVANAAAAAAKAKGWKVTLLNSEGALPKHAEQFDALIAKKVDAIIVAMGKPVEADAQFKAAKDKGIPVITVHVRREPARAVRHPDQRIQGRRRGGALSARPARLSGQHPHGALRPQCRHAHPRQGARRRARREPGGQGDRQVLDGAHPELARRRARRHAGAAAAEPGQDQRHLGLVRRAGLSSSTIC